LFIWDGARFTIDFLEFLLKLGIEKNRGNKIFRYIICVNVVVLIWSRLMKLWHSKNNGPMAGPGPNMIITMAIISLAICPLYASPLLGLDSTHIIFHYHGADSTSRLGAYLRGIGDINNDSYDDIALYSHSPAVTYIFLGGNPPDTTPDYLLKGNLGIAGLLRYTSDTGKGLLTLGDNAIYLYPKVGDTLASQIIDSINCPSGAINYGFSFVTEYVNNDSIADLLITGEDPTDGPKLFYYINPFASGDIPDWTYSINQFSHFIHYAGFVDYNGDGQKDIFVALEPDLDTMGFVGIFLGPNYGATPDIFLGRPIELSSLSQKAFPNGAFNIGDINNDGFEDLGVLDAGWPLVYLSGQETDTIFDYALDRRCRDMASAGDINGDYYNDVIIGGSAAAEGSVAVYLGGPKFDSINDSQIFYYDLPPLFLDLIGRSVASAGDFNGDGYGDIVFSCLNFAYGYPGDVFVIAGGSDIIVDVSESAEINTMPGSFLQQNYPNPFNPMTTIEFMLSKRGNIFLNIFDCTGRKIRSLIDGVSYSSGQHSIKWDGVLDNGKRAATGIYFYVLKSDNLQISRKMILLK
jgi:hypothetical protein